MLTRNNLTIFITALLALVTLVMPTTTQAQQTNPIDLAVGPPTTYLHLKPGTTSSHRLTIEQQGILPLEITPSLVDFASDGVSGQPVLKPNSTFRYASLTLPQDPNQDATADSHSFTLNPRQKKNITVNLNIPANASEGEFPLTILFRARPNSATTLSAGESDVSAVVGSNLIVLISESDQDQSSLSLEKITSWRFIDSLMPITFTITAKNAGSNATTATGSAYITNWQNQRVAEYSVYPDMILANSSRQLRTTQSIDEAVKDPSLITPTFSYRTLFLLGPYTITAQLDSGSATQVNQSALTQTVIALPFSFLVIIIVCFGAWRFFLLLNTKSSKTPGPTSKPTLDTSR